MAETFEPPPRWATEIFDKVREYPAMLDDLSTAELQAVRDAAEHELGEVVVRDTYAVNPESGELEVPYGLDRREIRLHFVAIDRDELWEQENRIEHLIKQIDAKLTPQRGRGRPPEYSENIKQAALDYYNRYKDRLHSVHDGVVTSFAREIYTHLSENFPADQLPDGNDKTCTTIRGWIGYK